MEILVFVKARMCKDFTFVHTYNVFGIQVSLNQAIAVGIVSFGAITIDSINYYFDNDMPSYKMLQIFNFFGQVKQHERARPNENRKQRLPP